MRVCATNTTTPDYKGFRFSAEMISYAVWLSFRFSLSFRDSEEILIQRGVVVTYAHGSTMVFARLGKRMRHELRRRRPHCGDKWHRGRGCPHHSREETSFVACR